MNDFDKGSIYATTAINRYSGTLSMMDEPTRRKATSTRSKYLYTYKLLYKRFKSSPVDVKKPFLATIPKQTSY